MTRRSLLFLLGAFLTMALLISFWFLSRADQEPSLSPQAQAPTGPPTSQPSASEASESPSIPSSSRQAGSSASLEPTPSLSKAERAALRRPAEPAAPRRGGHLVVYGHIEDEAGDPVTPAFVRWMPRLMRQLPLHDPVLGTGEKRDFDSLPRNLRRLLKRSRVARTDAAGDYRIEVENARNGGHFLAMAPGRRRRLRAIGAYANSNPDVRHLTRKLRAGESFQIEINFRLGPAGSISGHVRDGASGKPVAGIPIWAFPARHSDMMSSERSALAVDALTDRSGRYRMVGLRPTRYLVMTGRGAGYPPSEQSGTRAVILESEAEIDDVDFLVNRGGQVKARVTDDRGRPIVNASCRVEFSDPSSKGSRAATLLGLSNASTSRDGDCRIDGLPPDRKFSFWAFSQGFVQPDPIPITFTPKKLFSQVKVQLHRTAALSGRVVDAEDSPVAKANVLAQPTDRPDSQNSSRITTLSSADGTFEFNHLPPGDYLILARHAEYGGSSELHLKLASGEDHDDALIRMENSETEELGGVVVDDLNRPLADVAVTVFAQQRRARETTNSEGVFLFRRLTKGRYRIMARKDQIERTRTAINVETGQRSLRLVLPRPGRIRGRIEVAGKAVGATGGRVQVISHEGPGLRWSRAESAEIEPDGTFEVVSQPGQVEVKASVPDYASSRSDLFELPPGEVVDDVVIQLTGQAIIRGRIVESREGLGIAMAYVEATITPQPGAVGGRPRNPFDRHSTSTDGDGFFTLTDLPPGRAQITAIHSDYAPSAPREVALEAGRETQIKPLILTKGAVVAGRITQGGKPRTGLTVTVMAIGNSSDSRQAPVDSNGEFRVGGQRPGQHFLMVHKPLGSAGDIRGIRNQSFDLQEGQETYLEINLDGQRVFGRLRNTPSGRLLVLLFPENAPPRPADTTSVGQMQWFAQAAGQALVDSQGNFEVIAVPPGRYALLLTSSDPGDGFQIHARRSIAVTDRDLEANLDLGR